MNTLIIHAHPDDAACRQYLAACCQRPAQWSQTAPITYPSLRDYDPVTYKHL